MRVALIALVVFMAVLGLKFWTTTEADSVRSSSYAKNEAAEAFRLSFTGERE